MKIAVIGAGIAGQMIIHRLINQKLKLSSLDWYSAESFAPACSFSSTSIVRRAGITPGVSDLGDYLYNAYDEFESLMVSTQLFNGAYELAKHYQLGELDDLQFDKRYQTPATDSLFQFSQYKIAEEKAYLIYPDRLYKVIKEQFLSMDYSQMFIDTLVVDIQTGHESALLKTMDSNNHYDYVFVATGWNYQSIKTPETEFKNYLSGHYIEIASDFLDQTLLEKSWSLSTCKDINFIHRRLDNKLLISAANTKQVDLLPSSSSLMTLYHNAQSIFPEWTWPNLSSNNLKVGVRLKGVQRKPLSSWVTPRIAVLNGLYKNGFSFSAKFSKDLINKIKG